MFEEVLDDRIFLILLGRSGCHLQTTHLVDRTHHCSAIKKVTFEIEALRLDLDWTAEGLQAFPKPQRWVRKNGPTSIWLTFEDHSLCVEEIMDKTRSLFITSRRLPLLHTLFPPGVDALEGRKVEDLPIVK